MVATGALTWLWSCDEVAPGARRKLPTTTSSSSKETLQPSTKTGSPGCAGAKGSPATPSTSPEKVTWIESGLLVAAVKPGSQFAFSALLVPGLHFGLSLGLLELPPHATRAHDNRTT